jgi:hypothetical protein
MSEQEKGAFSQALGQWAGNAEVFDGAGRFLGNGADYRQVQQLAHGRVRIDVSFVGPFKHSGHYLIQTIDDYRLYQGPANIGYAETLSENLVDAHAYWPALGLSQRFFLMIVDEQLQLSLAQMARGEQLLYVIVGQNERVPVGSAPAQPTLVSGTHYDLQNDPAAGRAELWLQRAGAWRGELTALGENRQRLGQFDYTQRLTVDGSQLHYQISGGAFAPSEANQPHEAQFTSNHWQAWSTADSDFVGSYSLSGGRALSGNFYYPASQLRCWQREVATLDGRRKAVVQQWYRGGQRLGVQFGVLEFAA